MEEEGGEASRLAYNRYDQRPAEVARLTAALAAAGYGNVATFLDVGTDGQAFGCSDATHALLAIRGTQPDAVGDLFNDVDALLTPWTDGPPGAKVHAGFKRSAEGLWDDVGPWVAEQKGKRLTLCGHSLGAAIATLLCRRANADALVTVGSPRVGNEVFASDVTTYLSVVGREHHRIVNCCDVVARIPPEWAAYHHLGGDWTYIDGNGSIHVSPTPTFVDGDRPRAALEYLRQYAFQRGAVLVRDLADHAPINYLRAFWP